jgi:hypothetical protein
MERLIAACPILAKEQYTKRDMVDCVPSYISTYAMKKG